MGTLRFKAASVIPLLAGPLVASLQFEARAARDQRTVDDPAYTAPSVMVQIGDGRRLSLYCTGSGTTTVIFESGLGDGTRSWGLVQPQISRHARACSYDRAGLGFSDAANAPGTSANAVRDLETLLAAAKIPGPYVLVGHSYGAMIARLFSTRNSSSVAGLVLIDPSHEDVGRAVFALDPVARQSNATYLAELKRCLAADAQALVADAVLNSLCVDQPDPRYSARVNAAAQVRAAQPSQVAAWTSEMTNVWTESADEVRRHARTLGDLPLLVLTKEPSAPAPNETQEMRAKKNAVLELQQDQTAALSRQGRRLVVPESGHYIQLDQPSIVIEAILEVLRAVSR